MTDRAAYEPTRRRFLKQIKALMGDAGQRLVYWAGAFFAFGNYFSAC